MAIKKVSKESMEKRAQAADKAVEEGRVLKRADRLGRCVSCGIFSSSREYVEFKRPHRLLGAHQVICDDCVIVASEALGLQNADAAEKALRDIDIIFEQLQEQKELVKKLKSENKELLSKRFKLSIGS